METSTEYYGRLSVILSTYILLILFGALSNIFNAIVWRHPMMAKSNFNLILYALSITDLMTVTCRLPAFLFDLISLHITIPSVSLDWSRYYQYSLVLIDFFYTCSSFTFVIAMLARYLALCHRRNFKFLLTKRTIKIVLVICYTLAFSLNFPEIFISFKVITVKSGNHSYQNVAINDSGQIKSLWIVRVLIAGTIPFIIITYCIGRLVLVLHQNKIRINDLFSNNIHSLTRARRLADQDSATKTLLINVLAYMILVIPNDIYGIYAFATGDVNNTIRSILWVFLLANFCVNFLINVTVHKRFRNCLKTVCGISSNAVVPQTSISPGNSRSIHPITSVLKVERSGHTKSCDINMRDLCFHNQSSSFAHVNSRCLSQPILNASDHYNLLTFLKDPYTRWTSSPALNIPDH